MKTPSLVLLMVWCSLAVAEEALKYKIGGRELEFVVREKEKLTISKNCVKESGKLDCLAAEAPARAKGVGMAACRSAGGVITVGKSADGRDRGFCGFRDDSALSMDSFR